MIRWSDAIEIGTCIEKLGNSSFGTAQILMQNGKIMGLSGSVMVMLDLQAGRPAPMPDDVRAALEQYCLINSP